MTKPDFQKELLEKIKQGIKPSDLKKKPQAPSQTPTPASSPPASPIIGPIDKKSQQNHWQESNFPLPIVQGKSKKIQQLQEQVDFWSKTAQNHLTNLQRAAAQLDQAEEKIKELQAQPNQLSQEIATALQEANQKIREQKKTIKDLQNQAKIPTNPKPKETKLPTFTCSDCQQTKTHQELSRQFNNFSFCRSCSKKARTKVQVQKPEPQTQSFTCANCEQTQSGTPSKMKLDKSLQEYPICHQCRPTLKEFNEADLITDELWAKYPYSSASEILEKEFGIVKEEPW